MLRSAMVLLIFVVSLLFMLAGLLDATEGVDERDRR